MLIVLLVIMVSVVVWVEIIKGQFKSMDKKEGVLVFTPEGSDKDMQLSLDEDVKIIPGGKIYKGKEIEVTVEGGVVKRIKPKIGC